MFCPLCDLVCGCSPQVFFFMLCPSQCLNVMFSRFCLAFRGSWFLCFSLICGLCTVCLGLFVLPLGVVGRLCSVIVALPGDLDYSSSYLKINLPRRDLKLSASVGLVQQPASLLKYR